MITNWDSLVERVAQQIYEGRMNDTISSEMTKAHAEELMEAIYQGFGTSYDSASLTRSEFDALQIMERNVFHFSGAKNWNQLREFSALLLDDQRNRKPFTQYLKDVMQVNKTYNVTYLRTEYNHATAASQMIAKWRQIETEADVLPYLTFRAVMDDRTRQSHADLNGTTALWSDPFWKSHYPPLDWECRCDVLQGDKRTKPTSVNYNTLPHIPKMFQRSVGIDGTPFDESHQYFTSIPEPLRNTVKTIAEHLVPRREAAEDYTRVYKKGNKGFVDVHVKADKKDRADNIEYGKAFANRGYEVEILEHRQTPGVKNPEVKINGIVGDFKRPNADTRRSLQSQITSANSQGAKFAAIMLKDRNYSEQDIIRVLRSCLGNDNLYRNIDFVYLAYGNGEILKIERAEVKDWTFIKKIKPL